MQKNASDIMYHSKTIQETLNILKTTKNGLSSNEVELRQHRYGLNQINNKQKNSIILSFFSQFKDFMIIILIAAAGISFGVSYYEGSTDYADPLIILSIIILNAVLGTIQEAKAENSLEALKKMSAPNSSVIRNGSLITVESSELVPGDVILLESGNYVPADARLLESYSLQSDESALTGESVSVNKSADIVLGIESTIGDHKNMVYSSCIITGGHGKAVVTSTGINTQVGNIANMLLRDKPPMTPLQIRLAKTSRLLGTTALLICVFIFFIGILSGRPLFEMFMTSVSLAVASIPEGLPVFITIMLSIGVTRMAVKNAIIRKLPAVETLGSATYICSDKTGTLTQNQMTVTSIMDTLGKPKSPEFILKLASLCNNSIITKDNIAGSPTETAIFRYALKYGISISNLFEDYKRVYEIPFNSLSKIMTVVTKYGNSKYRYIVKGAPDVVIKRCSYYYDSSSSSVITLDENIKCKILEHNKNMAKNALRVIAVAYKDDNTYSNGTVEQKVKDKFIFAGLIGMIDPPRVEVKESVRLCKAAGITPVMITGDHPLTAMAIAKDLEIANSSDSIITGEQLNDMNDSILKKNVKKYKVFARVSPQHKVRIVKALQSNNEVVAMTGDGVNDAPALKAANIGCSMGLTGTDVAKSASDMILADDNFATIVDAVREGRGIYENIIKSIHFLLSSNIGEIITILVAIVFGLPTPLLAVQLLWINLVTDSLPAVALGVEPVTKEIMTRKPYLSGKSFFSKELTAKIIIEGIMIGSLSLLAFVIGYKILPINSCIKLKTARTMSFAVLGLSQLIHAFNMKTERSLTKINIFNNPKLIGAFIICVFLQVMVISFKVPAELFEVVSLDGLQWCIVAILSFLPIPIVELQKKTL